MEENYNCQKCKNTGMIECPKHKAEADGWCATCDTLVDEGPAGHINCECQD